MTGEIMKNYKIIISYDGGRYHGWERKNNVDTVEGKLETVLEKMTGSEVDLHGAGRTDAGVHAQGMVASGAFETSKSPKEIKDYMNTYLPGDICVREVSVAGDRFHARLNATGKIYQYKIYTGEGKPVFDRNYVWNLDKKISLSVDTMRQAGLYLVGTHDFRSFCGNNKMKKSTVRTIYNVDVVKEGDYITLSFYGDGFLQNMVRILVGTLVEIGAGKRKASDIPEIIEARNRQAAGPTAPALGLCLMEVFYN
jgi:tRNA pseudouridine38-40 synthase